MSTNDAADSPACPLCRDAGGEIAWRDARLRIVLPDEPDVPGLLRVILERHVREMTDLPADERDATMRAVWAAERAVRDVLAPHKVNVASLGNQVPHLHWHVVPRWRDDAWFPAAIWAAPRALDDAARAAIVRRRATARAALAQAIAQGMRSGA